jgi:hypothetical protein
MAKKKKEAQELQEEPQEEPIALGEVNTAPEVPGVEEEPSVVFTPPPSPVKMIPGKRVRVPKGEKM